MTVTSFCVQFQVLLYNSHNLTSVICLHTVCSIWPIERTLSGATTLGQNGPGSNGNEGVLHITHQMVWCLIQDTRGGSLYFFRDVVRVFYCPSWLGFLISEGCIIYERGYPRGVIVKAVDCGIVLSEFKLQSHCYIHFQTNTLGKGMELLSSQLWVK